MANRNRIKRTKGDVVLDVIIYILLTFLYPLFCSLKTVLHIGHLGL